MELLKGKSRERKVSVCVCVCVCVEKVSVCIRYNVVWMCGIILVEDIPFCLKYSDKINYIPYIFESNPHPFYSFRRLKNQMRIRIECGLDSRS